MERNDALSSTKDNLQDGFVSAVGTLRNCKMPDICQLLGSVAHTYRVMQEWCAPRILVDGTEAYSAVSEWSLTEAKNVFLDPDIVHLLRNPRACLGDAQGPGDVVELEKKWTAFANTVEVGANAQSLILYEDLGAAKSGSAFFQLFSRLSIPVQNISPNIQIIKSNPYDGPLQLATCSAAWHLGYKLSQGEDSHFLINDSTTQASNHSIIWL